MDEKLAKDYASFIASSAITTEQVEPIHASIDQMLTRLDEFESILSTVNNEAATNVQQNMIAIVDRRPEFMQICQQIDHLERFVDAAEHSVDAMEQSVNRADNDLGVNSLGLKGLLLRGKKWATETATGGGNSSVDSSSTAVESKVFIAPNVFRTGDFFFGNVSPE